MKEKVDRDIAKNLSMVLSISEKFFAIQKELKVAKEVNKKLGLDVSLILSQLSDVEDSILNLQEDVGLYGLEKQK